MTSDLFELIHQNHEAEGWRDRKLMELVHQWGRPIQRTLKRLAKAQWLGRRLLGFIPTRDYRIRQQKETRDYAWWVEHDIPPYDRYRCAAYLVKLSLNEKGRPLISVQSGAKTYFGQELKEETIQKLVAMAGKDPPLIIPRRMGSAMD